MELKQAIEDLEVKQEAQKKAMEDVKFSEDRANEKILLILSEYRNVAQKYADKYNLRIEIYPLGNIVYRLSEINRYRCSITLRNYNVVVSADDSIPNRGINKSLYNDYKFTEFSESALDQAIRDMIQKEIDESDRCLSQSKFELDKKQLEYDNGVEWLNKIKARLKK